MRANFHVGYIKAVFFCMATLLAITFAPQLEGIRRIDSEVGGAFASSYRLEISNIQLERRTADLSCLRITVLSEIFEERIILSTQFPVDLDSRPSGSLQIDNLPANSSTFREVCFDPGMDGSWGIPILVEAYNNQILRESISERIVLTTSNGESQVVRAEDFTFAQQSTDGRNPINNRSALQAAPLGIPPPPSEVRYSGTVLYNAVELERRTDTGALISRETDVDNASLAQAVLELWSAGAEGDVLLGQTRTNSNGQYQFPPISSSSVIDPYLIVYATDGVHLDVVDSGGNTYYFESDPIPEGTFQFDFVINRSNVNAPLRVEQALYAFDTLLNKAHKYVEALPGWDSGWQVKVHWPRNCILVFGDACYHNGIFIVQDVEREADVLIHEYGHFVLARFLGESKIVHACAVHGYSHGMFQELSKGCSFSEGWAVFFQMAVQNDPDYAGWMLENVDYHASSLELIQDGQHYEAFVAATLWDLLDGGGSSWDPSYDEPFDQVNDGFNGPDTNGIWNISTSLDDMGMDAFWEAWAAARGSNCSHSSIFRHHQMDLGPPLYTLITNVDEQQGSIKVGQSPNCPAGTFAANTVVNLIASPKQGFIFDQWKFDSSEPPSGPSIDLMDPKLSLTMDRDWEVTAVFAQWPPPPPKVPLLPICGDQDGSEQPYIPHCDQLSYLPEVSIFQVPGSGPVELTFDFVLRAAAYNNELGFYRVDSAKGEIDGLLPEDPGYLAAFFSRAQTIFPSGSNAWTADRTLHAEGGELLAFYLVQNGRLSSVISGNPQNKLNLHPHVFFSINALNPDGFDHFIGYENPSAGYTQFGFEDLDHGGDRDYDDVVYNVTPNLRPVSGRVDLSPLNAEPIVGEQETFTACVYDANGSPLSGALVTFTVEGANAQTGSARTDASGCAAFSYLAEKEGEDTVVASYKGWQSNRSFVRCSPKEPVAVCDCVVLCFFGGGSLLSSNPARAAIEDAIDRVSLLYRLRDEVMAPTENGGRYIGLFEQHTVEISALMLADDSLRAEGLAVLDRFLPGVQALVDGRGAELVLEHADLLAAEAFLERLAQAGSDELAAAIAAEQARQPLADLAGLTYQQAAYLLLHPPLGPETPGVIEATRMSAFLNLTQSASSNGKWEWTNHVNAPQRYWIAAAGDWLFFFPVTPADQARFDPSRAEDPVGNRLAIAARKTDFQKWFWCGITLTDASGRTTGSGCHPQWSPAPYGAGVLHPWYQQRIEQSGLHVLQTLVNTFAP